MTTSNKTRRQLYRIQGKKSLCRGKSIEKPNKCKKIKYCKVARGTKRSYCRKKRAIRYSKRVQK
jgi:hypothetical protein